jgi:cytochrome c-type biogenesis protein CcmH
VTTVAGGIRRDPARRRLFSQLSVAALVVTAAVALAIGSGLGRSSPPTLAERAAALESKLRCPSCEDVSVAQSDASSALAARHTITTMLGQGKSDAQIEQAFVDRWGPSILLEPPASGLSVLVFVVPAVAAALSLAALVALFWRRQRALRALREAT